MLMAAKPFTLVGQTYRPGQEIAPAVWAGLTSRQRKMLERVRFVRSSELQPVAQPSRLPVASSTPTRSGGPSRRGRPRKES